MAKRTVSVIGSLNIDFITRTSRLPAAGETFAALSFDTGFGGKGANQAVAAARLAGDDVEVRMVGQVGDDSFGSDYVKALTEESINVDDVRKLKDEKTGVTNIIVEEATGENRILFVANANNAYSPTHEPSWDMWGVLGEVVLFQLEIPLAVVLHNMATARDAGTHVILNPAPAIPLPESAYKIIDTLILNETESAILAGSVEPVMDQTPTALISLAKRFLSWGVKDCVIITLGEHGLVYATTSLLEGHLPAFQARVVDTTAAGDTFAGAYAVQRARARALGFNYEYALRFAALAASKTVEKAGAMASIPKLSELQLDVLS